jgi:hypothetical protein
MALDTHEFVLVRLMSVRARFYPGLSSRLLVSYGQLTRPLPRQSRCGETGTRRIPGQRRYR